MRSASYTTVETILPTELLEQPFVHPQSSKLELTVPRASFYMKISLTGIECKIGNLAIYNQCHYDNSYGELLVCQVSILNIYDSYGLEISKLFLQHVCELDVIVDWKQTYLYCSLVAMNPMIEASYHLSLSELSMLMVTELESLEASQPRCIEEITLAPQLPIELLARIINSKRVSKALAALVETHRCTHPLSEQELWQANSHATTMFYRGKWTLTSEISHERFASVIGECLADYPYAILCEWSLNEVSPQVYQLAYISNDQVEDTDIEGDVAEYSVLTYLQAYKLRGCKSNQRESLLSTLSQKFRTMNCDNVSTALAWIVQLSADTNSTKSKTMDGYAEVRDELQRLLGLLKQ